jgi:hypothetical protein
MQCTKLILFVIAMVAAGCSDHTKSPSSSQFDLQNGVSLIQVSPCSDEPSYSLSVKRVGQGWLITANGRASCSKQSLTPYLTVKKAGHSTLVLAPLDQKLSCECFRKFEINLTDRVERGDILYVLTGGEVLGHAQLP